MPSRGRRHIRKGKKTKAGCATDRDGYKRHGVKLGPNRVDPVAMWREYPAPRQYQLVRSGMSNRWATTDDDKEKYLQITRDAMASEDIAIALQGARCLLYAEKQNQDDQIKQKSDTLIQNIINMAEPTEPDPDFLQWKRERLMADQEKQRTTKLIESAEKYPIVQSGQSEPERYEDSSDT